MTIRLSKLPPGFALPPQKPSTASKPRRRPKSPAKAPEPLEREIQRSIIDALPAICPGCWVVRVNSGAMKTAKGFIRFNSEVGTPDILACIRGKFVGIEVKSAKGTVRPTQALCLEAIRNAGGYGFIVRSVKDLENALISECLIYHNIIDAL